MAVWRPLLPRPDSSKMPQKQKINRDKVNAALNTSCPKCGYSIPPSEIARLDSERMKCPKCGEQFVPGAGKSR
jgi:predicted RNA-binding Zn-ribbon protein involved in translation (DUF1610 family)